jgi:transposase
VSDDTTDTELEVRLFASEPNRAAVHRPLRRKHVTLSILWEEYIAGEPGRYRYWRFFELYRAWEGRLSVTMRQSYAAGDKLFVDYAGRRRAKGDRPADRRAARRVNLRRSTRRIELHLRAGDLDAGARRLDQRPRRRLRGDRRRSGAGGAGQYQGGGDQGLPLRPADQPQLC